ncbi:uncharacterized protein LOC106506828 [Sus scrofa]|uniref:uncharacterized protein LOC106506828 n=1 Tax=Sus scrofa TaxID=9823 RepID=UPI000A2B2334|nr:uncharacterized protein LOC106506828 [Sus scrofa]
MHEVVEQPLHRWESLPEIVTLLYGFLKRSPLPLPFGSTWNNLALQSFPFLDHELCEGKRPSPSLFCPTAYDVARSTGGFKILWKKLIKECNVPPVAALGRVRLAPQPLPSGELRPRAPVSPQLRLGTPSRRGAPGAWDPPPGFQSDPARPGRAGRRRRRRLPGRSRRSRWGRRPRLRVPAAPELTAGSERRAPGAAPRAARPQRRRQEHPRGGTEPGGWQRRRRGRRSELERSPVPGTASEQKPFSWVSGTIRRKETPTL